MFGNETKHLNLIDTRYNPYYLLPYRVFRGCIYQLNAIAIFMGRAQSKPVGKPLAGYFDDSCCSVDDQRFGYRYRYCKV